MKRLKNWAYLIVVVAFLGLGFGIEYGGEYLTFPVVLIFLGLLVWALFLYARGWSKELDNDFNPKKEKLDDPLTFTIKYDSPLLKKKKIVKSSNQLKIRDIIEKLAKKEIEYEIRVEVKD